MRRQEKEYCAELFETAPMWPVGFHYKPDLLSEADEKALVKQFEALPFKPFEFRGYLGNRRIVSFGYRYDYAGRALREAEPIPTFLEPLKDVIRRLSGIAASFWQQAMVTEYAPKAGIGWHRDKPMFAEVTALSFLAPCILRLRRKNGLLWTRKSVPIAPRSGYLLSGQARDEWQHSIAPMEVLRYSVTFRSFRDHLRRSDVVKP